MKESGYYPPGAEYDPDAPWNQKPGIPLEDIIGAIGAACELFDTLQALKDIDPSWFSLYQPLGKVLSHCQAIIDGLKEAESELL